MQNVFLVADCEQFINRINKLKSDSQPLWGKMSVDQMLAHCNVTYEMVYDNIHPKPNAFLRLILKSFVKKKVVDETPYPKNIRTARNLLYLEIVILILKKRDLYLISVKLKN